MMDHVLDQLRFHPWTAVLAGIAFLVCLALLLRKNAGRPRPLSTVLGLALFALSVGLAASVQGVVDTFHGIALTGSGGNGAVADGLAETRGAFLLGLIPASLILAAGLLLYRGTSVGPGEEPTGPAPILGASVLLISAALAAVAITAIGLYDIWFVGSIPGWVSRATGNAETTSQEIAGHLNRLRFLSFWAVPASLALVILPFFLSGNRPPTSRQTVWGRPLLALLLVLSLIGVVVVWRQLARFEEAAMIGKFF